MKIAITTLGCKVNQYESAAAAGRLKHLSQLVDFDSFADIYIINTCAVTKEAERKSRQLIYRARRLNPEARIVALGCYTEIAAERLKGTGVDLIIGNRDKDNLLKILFPDSESTLATSDEIIKNPERTRAIIKIQDGCDQFCSYCLIPFMRSTLMSKNPTKVINEVNLLAQSGIKEAVLTGIHLGKYGFDLAGKPLLDKLVSDLIDSTDISRIRFSSLEPTEVSDRLLCLLSTSKRLAKHLHLPIQSGDNDILKAMNRPYTAGEYLKIINKIKSTVPNIAITTDIIVGFPGETESHFINTLNMVKNIGFSRVHAFKYSDRPLTSAFSMAEKVAAPTRIDRSKRLRNLATGLSNDFAAAQVGKTLEVLVEKADRDYQQGLSENYLRVNVSSESESIGRLFRVRIEKAVGSLLYGKTIE